MLISACVITKNEEKTLPTWLSCVKQIADEIVVVDTGSTDRTVEIAKEGGARVEYFHWINDFSAARNYAIEQVRGKWILFLDADHYFLPDDCRRVKAAIKKYDARLKVVSLIFHIVDVDQDTGRLLGSDTYNVHCFRNLEWLRYERKIHEILVSQSKRKTGTAQYLDNVTLYHTGYSKTRIKQKLRRNLELLQDAQNAGKHQDIDDLYFADCYYGLGDYEKAIHYAYLAVENRVKAIGMEKRPYGILIQSMIEMGYSSEKIYETLEKAVKEFPEAPGFHLTWGLQNWREKDYYGAEKHFLYGLELREKDWNNPQRGLITSDVGNILPTVYFCLGEIAAWRGRDQKAIEYLVKALKEEPGKWEVLPRLCRLMKAVPPVDFIEFFNNLCMKERDGKELAIIFARLGMNEAALYYERCSGEQIFDDIEHYILAGNISSAGTGLRKKIRDYCDLGSWLQNYHPSQCRTDFGELLPDVYNKAAIGQDGEETVRIRRVWEELECKYGS